MNDALPSKIILQWHVTERCNLRCSHCYQDAPAGNELAFESLAEILVQYKDLLDRVASVRGRGAVRGHVTVTGGEPYLRSDFPRLLEHLSGNRSWASFGILTNGSFIDRSAAADLKTLRVSFVQVSIEGTRSTHDRIRGAGSHDRAVSALRCLADRGIRTLISFTAHKGNYREFPDVVALGRKLNVWRVWSDRMIPRGNGNTLGGGLDPAETREFFGIMHRARESENRKLFRRTEVAMGRALQFLVGGGKPYRCNAGKGLITVMPDGTLYPCRRMPMPVGTLPHDTLSNLYFHNELFRSLRDGQRVSDGCAGCLYQQLCGGGLRCLSAAVGGNPFLADPGCWKVPAAQRAVAAGHQEVC